jgi:hypothetical protein
VGGNNALGLAAGAIDPLGLIGMTSGIKAGANVAKSALASPPAPTLIAPQGNEPTPSDPATAASMQDAEEEQRNAKGRASTYLTSDGAGSPMTFSKSLLAS